MSIYYLHQKKYYIFNKVEEPRATSVSNIPNEITQIRIITKTAEVIIAQENLYLSIFNELGASLWNIKPDQKKIFAKNNIKEIHLFIL